MWDYVLSVKDNMKEYINKIVLGDCLELFKNIPDNSIDVTFADPPYNLQKNIKTIKTI